MSDNFIKLSVALFLYINILCRFVCVRVSENVSRVVLPHCSISVTVWSDREPHRACTHTLGVHAHKLCHTQSCAFSTFARTWLCVNCNGTL